MYVLVVYIVREHRLRFFRGVEPEIGWTVRSRTAEADVPDLAEASRSRDELQKALGTFAERWSSDKYRSKEKYLVPLTEATTSCLDFLIAAYTHTHTHIYTDTLEKRSFRQTNRQQERKIFTCGITRNTCFSHTDTGYTNDAHLVLPILLGTNDIYSIYIYI